MKLILICWPGTLVAPYHEICPVTIISILLCIVWQYGKVSAITVFFMFVFQSSRDTKDPACIDILPKARMADDAEPLQLYSGMPNQL